MSKGLRKLLKISEIAHDAGVLPSTIRYYTDIGLIAVADETPGGHRLYDRDETLAKISKIQFLNQQGKTMEEIKKELAAAHVKKVLVIDDEPETGALVEEVIKAKFPDFQTRVVYDGFSAGRVLNEYIPDLIILDLMLPGINGFDMCRQIRSEQFLSNVKILAITGYDSPENKAKIMACGATDYLAKPMELQPLINKIASLLETAPKAAISSTE